jgi:hypothetical protein
MERVGTMQLIQLIPWGGRSVSVVCQHREAGRAADRKRGRPQTTMSKDPNDPDGVCPTVE